MEFERLIAELWSKQGWRTQVTQEIGDRGIDVVATKNNPVSEKHLIQVKRYGENNSVGSPDVQQYASLRQQEDSVDAVVIVTSSQFTTQAKEVADDLNVKLVDGNELCELINSTGINIGRGSQNVRDSANRVDTTTTSSTSNNKWIQRLLASFVCAILAVLVLPLSISILNADSVGTAVSGLSSILFIFGYTGTVISIYNDAKHLSKTSGSSPNTILWTVGCVLLWNLTVPYYMYKRIYKKKYTSVD